MRNSSKYIYALKHLLMAAVLVGMSAPVQAVREGDEGIDLVEVLKTDKGDGSILFMDMEPISKHEGLPEGAVYTDVNASPEDRAWDAVNRMTLDEKLRVTGGVGSRCTPGVPRLGLRDIHMQNAGQGIGVHLEPPSLAKREKSTAYPCVLMLAASWNEALAYEYGEAIGKECRALYVDILEGPGVNMYRHSASGRNFEYMGEDPFLASRMVVEYVKGLQSLGVVATPKHLVANDHDMNRHIVNIIVSERALHEIYMAPFTASVLEADSGALMTGNNFVNGWPGAGNKPIMADYLRGRLGYKGLIMSDFSHCMFWQDRRDLILTSGLSLVMARNNLFVDYYRNEINEHPEKADQMEKELDLMVFYNLYTHFKFGIYDRHSLDKRYLNCFEGHKEIARRTAEEGITLLKNEGNVLPIKPEDGKKIAVIGTIEAMEAYAGRGSGGVIGYDITHNSTGLKKMYGDNCTIYEDPSKDRKGNKIPLTYKEATDEDLKNADVIIYFINKKANEGSDRPFHDPRVRMQMNRYTRLNDNVVVVYVGGSACEMPWLPQVEGLVYAYLGGQETGNALANVISGKVCPSGRLPFTIEKKFDDGPGKGYNILPDGKTSWSGAQAVAKKYIKKYGIIDLEYKEGVYIGYRWYEKHNINVNFPFGFGLSYTTFEMGDPTLSAETISKDETVMVRVPVTNTGDVEGAQIVQLYIHAADSTIDRPEKELKGFKRINLKPGETGTVEIPVMWKHLAYWDEAQHDWAVEPGEYEIRLGASSAEILQSIRIAVK